MALPKYAPHAAIALAALGVLYYLKKLPSAVQQAGQNLLKPVTDAIWSGVQAVTPYDGVQYTSAGFYLNAKYVSPSYKINSQFIESMILAHQGNKALIEKLADPYGVIRPQYRHLIDNEVTARTLQ